MRTRLTGAALALALSIAACTQDMPTGGNSTPEKQAPQPALQQQQAATLLRNITVTYTSTVGGVTQTLTGTLTIRRFAVNQAGQLLVSGVLRDATGAVVATFTRVVSTLVDPTGTCTILDLDIGAIHLNLLGLVIDIAPIHIDITGQTGQNQLLGNLLCALAGLLDNTPFPLSQILQLLAQLNQLLG